MENITRINAVRVIITLFFVGLLLAPAGLRQIDRMNAAEIFEDKEKAIQRYGFFLEDVTSKSGIDFVHQRPELDPKLEHILPQIASVGASVSISDFNNSGHPDIYLTNSAFGSKNALYMNKGDGTFVDVAEEMGVADLNEEDRGVSMGAIWGDINNNGYEDLLVYRWGKPELFLNNYGTGFTRITEEAGLGNWMNANTAVWLDYNNDGFLDLFIGGYFHEDVNFWNLETTRIMPDSYEYATNGGRNYLYENQGDGTFVDVTEQAGLLETRRWTLAAASTDLNGSGYPDLVLANDYGVDELFLNENGTGFRSAGEQAGMGFIPKSGMSVDFGDISNQGQFAVYITNISEAGVLMQGNNLWVPTSRSEDGNLRFRNLANNLGVEIGEWGYSGKFVDFNNDGNLDLYVANGYVSDEPNTDYWYDYAKVVGGNRNIIIDAVNWPAMNNRTFSGYQNNKIWLNDGAGRFQEVAAAVGGLLNLDSRSVATADLFGTGSSDLIVANQNGPVKVYKNHTNPENNWISFKLQGTKSNHSAIGALVTIYWENKQHKKTISGGSSFSSQSERSVHFGLSGTATPDSVVIQWPSGTQKVLYKPESNKVHQLSEPIES